MAALWVLIQTSLKNTKKRHKERKGQPTLARQNYRQKKYFSKWKLCIHPGIGRSVLLRFGFWEAADEACWKQNFCRKIFTFFLSWRQKFPPVVVQSSGSVCRTPWTACWTSCCSTPGRRGWARTGGLDSSCPPPQLPTPFRTSSTGSNRYIPDIVWGGGWSMEADGSWSSRQHYFPRTEASIEDEPLDLSIWIDFWQFH